MWRRENSWAYRDSNSRPSVVKPVASCCTDWAILQAGRSWVRIPMMSLNFFNLPNPSSHNMALGSTHPLTEMSTRKIPGCKRQRACKADNLTTICEPIVQKIWKPWPITPLWAFTACYRNSFAIFSFFMYNLYNGHSQGAIIIVFSSVSAFCIKS
jgi:hypothetical protein